LEYSSALDADVGTVALVNASTSVELFQVSPPVQLGSVEVLGQYVNPPDTPHVIEFIAEAPSPTIMPCAVGFATPNPPFVGNRTDAPTAFELARLSDWNSGSAEPPFATSGAPDAELGPTPTMFDVLSPTSTE
jgi:hypothetical protein